MKRVGTFITGLLVGATLFGGTAAYAAGVMAEQSELKPAPKVGDVILCSDGYAYEIKDVSKYNNSMFATEETDALPAPTCDWSLLVQPALPEPEARHFTAGGKEYLFVRNLYETDAVHSL